MAIIVKTLLLIMGVYMLIGSIKNWDSLLTGRREALSEKVIGRMGNRIFYGFIGTLTIAIAIIMFFGDIDFLI